MADQKNDQLTPGTLAKIWGDNASGVGIYQTPVDMVTSTLSTGGMPVTKGLAQRTVRTRLLERIVLTEAANAFGNIRTRGAMSSPPTFNSLAVQSSNPTNPSSRTNGFLVASKPELFQFDGVLVGPTPQYKTVTRGLTGGNLGLSGADAGAQNAVCRVKFNCQTDSITYRLLASVSPYRWVVEGQYESIVGHTSPSQPGTWWCEHVFSSWKGREIILELQGNQALIGVYLNSDGNVRAPRKPRLKGAVIADSWADGTAATAHGDGLFMILADRLGIDRFLCSGSPSQGVATANTPYNHLQRIQAGDLLLSGIPEIIFLPCSLNDKNQSAASVTANVTAMVLAARAQAPNALIVGIGMTPIAGANNGTLSAVANEAAFKAGMDASGDDFSIFIPIASSTDGVSISSAQVGILYSSGDVNHLIDLGHSEMADYILPRFLLAVQTLLANFAA